MDWLFHGYWPWWFSAIAFAALVVGIWVIERRLLGVSGSYAELLRREGKGEREFREASEEDPSLLEDAMLKATLEEFGPEAMEAFRDAMAEEEGAPAAPASRPSLPASVHGVFLAMLVVGGAIGAFMTGSWSVRFDLGSMHTALLGGGGLMYVLLILGGVLTGFGTRMAGGCTSGHGLSGCSRMQVASLVSTASFFGTGVAVSYLLEVLAR